MLLPKNWMPKDINQINMSSIIFAECNTYAKAYRKKKRLEDKDGLNGLIIKRIEPHHVVYPKIERPIYQVRWDK